ncbi:ABC transporter substrate-binding protein [Sporomusa sphaeroides]|uniref:ABC transporter substrate-binding protein n=1 Tax=Sporomusa sphaeroides TaxID=47679 RepID=UPI002C098A8D|nr:ABC transporter substrate-binding protein [Sporomusa sphaeroides]HML33660.1 ABC transporter substrate-binding protein [Sporomusa sphaeroides]
MKKCKGYVALCLVLMMIAATLAGCSNTAKETAAAKKDDYVMKIPVSGGLCNAPLHVALDKGMFEEAGIKYEITKIETNTVDLMVAGKADAFSEMLPAMIQQINNGLDVNIAMGIHTGCLKLITKKDSPINSVKDLKGKKIGVPGLASSQAIIAQRALLAAGIGASPENMEVEFVVYNQPELPIALKNGQVDVIGMSDPAASLFVADEGSKLILDTAVDPEYKNEYCCVLVLRPDFVKQHPEIAKKYVGVIKKAGEYVQNHPEEVAKMQVDKKIVALGNPEFNAGILKTYKFIPSVPEGKQSFKNNLEDLQRLKIISKDLDLEQVIKKVYLEFDK